MANLQSVRLEIARALVSALESGASDDADHLIGQLTFDRDHALFREIGQLTRGLHDQLNQFSENDRIVRLASEEIPDARQRLKWVMEKTEKAALDTLDAVERSMPLTGQILESLEGLKALDPTSANFPAALDAVLVRTQAADEELQNNLTVALMAQDYQDLTGQIITKVIVLVEEVESKLVELVRISGQRLIDDNPAAPAVVETPESAALASSLDGPQIEGLVSDDAVDGQGDVDALLSAFGF